MFIMKAIDLNNGVIHYSWHFNNSLLPNQTSSQFMLKADKCLHGDYKLSLVVTNSISLKTANWQIKISTSTDVKSDEEGIPISYQLYQNYPNPFNPTSTIQYDLPKTGFVNISIYDVLGREVKVLVSELKSPGRYEVIFNAKELSSGIYFYQFRSISFVDTNKFILIK